MKKKKFEYILNNASNVFFTSDTHFGHENIIKMCKRPFHDAKEMDEVLIENWNRTVPSNGTVFHLGDFAWGGYPFWKQIRNRLNGEIILIVGNHDFKNGGDFSDLFSYITPQMYIKIEGRRVFLNHVPFLCYAGTYRRKEDIVYQLFGHVHTKDDMTGLDKPRLKYLFPFQYDVGVDNNNYTPISWGDIKDKVEQKIKLYDSNKS